jgi:hypothetical protein
MTVQERLQEAIGTGEIIGVRYHGGSQPGTFREIVPLAFEGNCVRAHCLTSHATKTFALDKIELAAPDQTRLWTERPLASVTEILALFGDHLRSLGWHVDVEDHDGDQSLSLHSHFKNGKVRKASDVSIHLQPTTWDAVAQPDGTIAQENFHPRTRPWAVASKDFTQARTFKNAMTAVAVFLQQADALAPSAGASAE